MSTDATQATKKRKRGSKKEPVVQEEVQETVPTPTPAPAQETAPSTKPTKPAKRLSAKNKTKKLQKSTKPLFSRAPLERYTRGRYNEISQESSGLGAVAAKPEELVTKTRICSDAIDLLQQGVEKFLSETCNQAACVMKNRGKTTLTIHDIRVAKQVRDDELSKQIVHELNTVNPIIVKHKKTAKTSNKKRRSAAPKSAAPPAPNPELLAV